ncbi:MAG: hypothetical protein ACR2NU_12310 [Aeoliella sp.]
MSNRNPILLAKLLALLGFLALITCTYYLRSEVLALSHIRFSADEVRDAEQLKQRRESYPNRVKQHKMALQQYELQQEHYRQMLDLYENNYDEYVKRIEDKYELPQPPYAPTKPSSPEVAEKLYDINAQFRARKSRYFSTSSRLNWLACAAALMLVGGLMYLLLFDTNGQRWHYLVALVISFVFLIGPAFHSIMTGIIGFLKEPGIY